MATSHVDTSIVGFLPGAQSRVMAAMHGSIDVVYRLPAIRARKRCYIRFGEGNGCPHHIAYPLRDGRGLIVASVSSPPDSA